MNISIIGDYRLPPGVCYLCKAARRYPGELLVDTGLMVDSPISGDPNSPAFAVGYTMEPLVICEACLTELGRAIGLLPRPRLADPTRPARPWAACNRSRVWRINGSTRSRPPGCRL